LRPQSAALRAGLREREHPAGGVQSAARATARRLRDSVRSGAAADQAGAAAAAALRAADPGGSALSARGTDLRQRLPAVRRTTDLWVAGGTERWRITVSRYWGRG